MPSPISPYVEELPTIKASILWLNSNLGPLLSGPGQESYRAQKVSHMGWVARQSALEDEKFRFPLIGFVLREMRPPPDFYWNKMALFNGFYRRSSNSPNVLWHYKLVRVLLTFSVFIRHQDEEELHNMMQRYMVNAREAQTYMKVLGISLKTKIAFTETFAMPEQENEQDGNVFTSETSVFVYTYLGIREVMRSIDNIGINLKSEQNCEANNIFEKLDLKAHTMKDTNIPDVSKIYKKLLPANSPPFDERDYTKFFEPTPEDPIGNYSGLYNTTGNVD